MEDFRDLCEEHLQDLLASLGPTEEWWVSWLEVVHRSGLIPLRWQKGREFAFRTSRSRLLAVTSERQAAALEALYPKHFLTVARLPLGGATAKLTAAWEDLTANELALLRRVPPGHHLVEVRAPKRGGEASFWLALMHSLLPARTQ